MKHTGKWLLLLLSLAGCSGSDGGDLGGTYQLVRVGDRALPAAESETSGCVFTVSRGALQFPSEQRFTWMQNLQALCGMQGGMPPISSNMSGTYTLTNGTLTLRFEPRDSATQQQPFTISGLLQGDSIVLAPSAGYPLPRTYRKQETANE